MNVPARPTSPPPTTPESGWIDPNFTRNQNKIPLSELLPWVGKHVAWTWDGTRVIAGAETLGGLMEELDRQGIPTSTVVFDYIDDPDIGNFGVLYSSP